MAGGLNLDAAMNSTKGKQYGGADPDLLKKASGGEFTEPDPARFSKPEPEPVVEDSEEASEPESEPESGDEQEPADDEVVKPESMPAPKPLPGQQVPLKKPASKGKKVPSMSIDKSKAELAFLRDVPREMIAFARSKFPNARNQTDAVCAYVYVRSGKSFSVDDNIKELAKTWSEDKSFESMQERLMRMEQANRKLLELVSELTIMNSYVIFDRLGFRREQPSTPEKINLTEPGMDDMLASVRRQATAIRKRQALKDGRPQRQEHQEPDAD